MSTPSSSWCRTPSAERIQAETDDHLHKPARDMIDQQLSALQSKELGIKLRCRSHPPAGTISASRTILSRLRLWEKAAASQGVSFEDFKQGIANQCITQQVVRDEVGRHIQMTQRRRLAYYNAHTKDF